MEMAESEIHQLFVKSLDGKHKILNFDTPSISVSILKRRIEALTSVPSHLQLLRFSDSRILHDHETLKIAESRETTEIPETLELNNNGLPRNQLVCSGMAGFQSQLDREVGRFPVLVHLSLRLRGGRRGFTSLLRGAAAKAGQKKTNNFDACRDMSGRRLRHVNAEKKLEEWRPAADERKFERMAEYIKKKNKEVAKNAKSKGGDSAEKYVAKYREESSRCMEEVGRSVRESMMNGLKRKSGKMETENHAKRLKIWSGKRKMGDSDGEDMDEEEIDGDEKVAKSVTTDNGNLSDPSKEAEEASCSITCEKVISGPLDEGYQEEDVSAEESPKSDNSIDGCVDDGKCISRNKPAVESPKESTDHDGDNPEVPSSQLQKMRSTCCPSTCCPSFCCPISIVTAIALLFLLSALGFFFLWFEPRLPEFHLKSIDFKKFNITTTPDGLTLDAQSIVSVEVKNPNSNLRMEYGRTRIYVNAVDGDTNLGQVTVPGFMQDKNNVTTLKFTTRAENEILESKIAEELRNGFKNKKLLMNVVIESGIGIKSSGWAIGTVEVKVLCGGVSLSLQVQEGRAATAAPKCRIKILDWVYLNCMLSGAS